jgi:hypothetical protein
LSSRRDFLEVWIVVALAQQSLIQIKIDLAGPKRLELLLIPFLVKCGFLHESEIKPAVGQTKG